MSTSSQGRGFSLVKGGLRKLCKLLKKNTIRERKESEASDKKPEVDSKKAQLIKEILAEFELTSINELQEILKEIFAPLMDGRYASRRARLSFRIF